MKIDCNLDVAQSFGGRGEWRGFSDLFKGGAVFAPQFARPAGYDRQDGKAACAQRPLQLVARVNPAVH